MSGLPSATIVRLRSVPPERTPQRLDPLGVQSAWTLVPIIGVVAIGYAVLSTLLHQSQIRDAGVAVSAIAVLAVAVTAAAIRTHPGLAPVGRWTHFSVIGVAVAASCLFSASVWGANERIQDDWGQIAVALLVTAMPLYRPVGEVLATAAVAAVVLGTVAALQGPSLVIHNNPIIYATVAATPVLALAAGGSGYAWTMTHQTLRWRELARAGQQRLDGELRQAAERMIAQERATTVNTAAAPFLAHILAADVITEEDRERAVAIAADLRRRAVRAVERTWLSETVDTALSRRPSGPGHGLGGHVDDPDRLDRVLSDEQRAIVGALVATLARQPGLEPATVHIVVSEPEHPSFALTATVHQTRSDLRRALLPYLSALSAVSLTVSMHVTGSRLAVGFAYPGSRS